MATLRDAASYIMNLPAAEKRRTQWRAAAEAILMAAEDRGPLMHARIGNAQDVEPREATADAAAKAQGDEEISDREMKNYRRAVGECYPVNSPNFAHL